MGWGISHERPWSPMPPETTIPKVNNAPAAALVHHFVLAVFRARARARARARSIEHAIVSFHLGQHASRTGIR